MILKGSQRGGARQLAAHLLKVEENEHVEIHEIAGFVSEDLDGALREIYAISQGTRCRQFMFSLSLNPPEKESVPIEYFEKALTDIEKKLKLEGQPRAIVFHEKEGRRHCHAVWSRIDTNEMKAINLPYFKMKLQDISRQLYFQYGWQIPRGLMNKEERNPLNFSLKEWQQAKRLQEDPQVIKQLFQSCWEVSDSKDSFADALQEHGYGLARGDQRGYVAVDYQGEVFSLSRWAGLKRKQLKDRLGNPEALSSINTIRREMAKPMTDRLRELLEEVKKETKITMEPLLQRKRALVKHHRETRAALVTKQEARCQHETLERLRRLPCGIKGIWFRLIGKYQNINAQNEQETKTCGHRDRDEKQTLVIQQLSERQQLQQEFRAFKEQHQAQILELKQGIARSKEMLTGSQKKIDGQQKTFGYPRDFDHGPAM